MLSHELLFSLNEFKNANIPENSALAAEVVAQQAIWKRY